MIKKKGSFWTFMFSLFPGAAQMYMGFMKQGISIMSIFFLLIFFASWLNIGPLTLILPVLWFYSFFDGINKMSLSDEEFYSLEDFYILSVDKLFSADNTFFKKKNLFFGVILVILGVFILWSNILNNLHNYLPIEVYGALQRINHLFPQFALGAIILVIGIKLIIGKKKESVLNDKNS